MNPLFFYLVSAITVLMIVMMIFQKNPISSAVCLVTSFFTLAGIYVTLDAHFVATLQILVYAGAIMVLFTFVIMLLNLKEEELTIDRMNIPRFVVILMGLSLFGFVGWQLSRIPTVVFPKITENFGTAESIGKILFTKYVVPFELIGLLLLVGIVGAILLARRES